MRAYALTVIYPEYEGLRTNPYTFKDEPFKLEYEEWKVGVYRTKKEALSAFLMASAIEEAGRIFGCEKPHARIDLVNC